MREIRKITRPCFTTPAASSISTYSEWTPLTKPVIIVDYDSEWPSLYMKEKRRLTKALGSQTREIEHIGSTAVPGFAAKPIVDLMVAVDDAAQAERLQGALAELGYDDVSKIEGNPQWFYCLGRTTPRIGYHLHLVQSGSPHWNRHILFRDHLRRDPETAREYQTLKRGLAEKYRTEREKYTEAKTDFIQETTARATP